MRVGRTYVFRQGGTGGNDEFSRICVSTLLFIVLVGVPCLVYIAESVKYDMGKAFHEAQDVIEEVPNDNTVYPSHDNTLIHMTSHNLATIEILHDPDFNIEAPSSVKLSRKTEFCQWTEHYTDEKQSNGDTVRTYYYVKTWMSHPIISAFYDQPFAHNNPQRNPFPQYSITANGMKAGAYLITKPLIQMLPITNTLQFTSELLNSVGFYSSPAFVENGFNYIGGGYFYSPYQASSEHTILKLAGQFFEGSLFDFQIGDLFSQCTAGDIRVRFDAAIPTKVSVVGMQQGDKIVPYIAANEYSVGLLYHGEMTAEKMFEAELSSQQVYVYIARIALFFWAMGVATIAFDIQKTETKLLASLFLTGVVVGFIWSVVWSTYMSFLLTLISFLGFCVIQKTNINTNTIPTMEAKQK